MSSTAKPTAEAYRFELEESPMAQETVCSSNNVVAFLHAQEPNSANTQSKKRQRSASDQGTWKRGKLARSKGGDENKTSLFVESKYHPVTSVSV